jgi:glycosyltransferase involved in cell wall biosynthesis
VRILFVYSYLPTHVGGIETAIDALACELARRSHEVTVLGAHVPSAQPPRASQAYRTVSVPALNAFEERLGIPVPLFHPLLVPLVRRAVAAAEVVHAHGFLSPATLTALALARLGGRTAPIRVLTEHVGHVAYASRSLSALESAAIATVGRTTVRCAEAVVVYNTRVASEISRLVPGATVQWIENGVDRERYHPPASGERAALRAERGWDERPRVLFVGRLVAKKGVHLATAAAQAAGGAFELVVVGPGRLDRAGDHVRVLGPLPPEEVARLYRSCDAFLLPSSGEGFPLSAQEALASGLPVFLGEDPTYKRYTEGAGTSIVLVPKNAQAIAAAVCNVLRCPDALALASRQAATHASRSFSWARSADAHEELIGRLHAKRA